MAPRRRLAIAAVGEFRRDAGAARRTRAKRQSALLLLPRGAGRRDPAALRRLLPARRRARPTMSRLDELRDVASLVGIGTRHVDALGIVHEPGEETLSRLIAAFGLPAD